MGSNSRDIRGDGIYKKKARQKHDIYKVLFSFFYLSCHKLFAYNFLKAIEMMKNHVLSMRTICISIHVNVHNFR